MAQDKNKTTLADSLVRPNIKQTKAYMSARSLTENSEEFTFLDAAESHVSPFDPDTDLKQTGILDNLNSYPDQQPEMLAQKLAQIYKTSAQNILITRGSEEAIRLVMQSFCVPSKDCMITCPPTFALYAVECSIQDIKNIQILRTGKDYKRLDLAAIEKSLITKAPKIVMICNPGNPSSTQIHQDDIAALVALCRDRALLVIDEAYIEYSDQPSCTPLIGDNDHIIVLRTLSKSYGLAGLRCGSIIASPSVLNYVRRVIAPYPVGRQTYGIALLALSNERLKLMHEHRKYIAAERARIQSALKNAGSENTSCVQHLFPSAANFMAIKVKDPVKTVSLFKKHGLIIRDRSAAIPNCVNIAITDKATNDKIISLLTKN